MKRVLIITYYWPPKGGAGVQRWLKFSKYLGGFGWRPVIYTPEGGEVRNIDASLEKEVPDYVEVVRRPIWEPFNLYRRLVGKNRRDRIDGIRVSEAQKLGFKEELSIWIRGNCFVPDSRVFWIRPSVSFLLGKLEKLAVDVVVSSGPPHSMHLIGLGLKRTTNIPWVADFRDPWTNIDFYEHLKLGSWADGRHRRLEKKVLRTADRVVTVSWNWAKALQRIGGRPVNVIPNGYDSEDFRDANRKRYDGFVMSYVGELNRDRNIATLWAAIKQVCLIRKDFCEKLRIRLVGSVDGSVMTSVREHGLESKVELVEYVPHEEAVRELQKAHLLILLINNTKNAMGIIPGKLFEYMASGSPILCIGHRNSDCARVIQETGVGGVAGFDEKERIIELILGFYDKGWRCLPTKNSKEVERYDRRTLAGEMSQLLNELVGSWSPARF